MEADPHYTPVRKPSPIVLLLLAVGVGFLVWSLVRSARTDLHDEGAQPRAVTPRGDLTDLEKSNIAVYDAASRSVVHVENIALLRDRWTRDILQIPRGTGSGFVWDARGYVVTNDHVVRGGDSFVVTLADGTQLKADLVGTSPDNDVAVLKVETLPADGLPPLALGTSSDLRVGQAVFAIGNPFGLDQTLTTGVISGVNRQIRADTGRSIDGVIQTDAAINPGNSGGPLLDSAGRVIGINTAIVGPAGQYSGVGFAVPIDTVNRVVPVLIRGERPQRAGLGITLLDPRQLGEVGIEGAGVESVVPDSAADKAGLEGLRRDRFTGRWILGDVIVGVDDKPVRSREDLFDALDAHAIGDTVRLRVRRDEGEVDVQATLQAVSR